MAKWLVVVLGLGLAPVAVQAQSQEYLRMDGKKVATNDKDLWTYVPEKEDKGGYYQCLWVAKDREGKEINRQVVIYFDIPFKNKENPEEKSHAWVYWFKPAPANTNGDIGTFWGRCPTPKHPKYKEMQKVAQGDDLWEIIPDGSEPGTKNLRQPNVTTLADLKGTFGPTISTTAKQLPKIAKGQNDTITCIDFNNPVFN